MRTTGSGVSPRVLSSSSSTQTTDSLSSLASTSLSTMAKRATAAAGPPFNEEEQKESSLSASEAPSQVSFGGDVSESKPTSESLQATPLAVPVLDTSNPRRRRTYGQQRVSEDHKRERNRETFRRFYKRKQDTLRDLREQEEQLAQQYERLKLSHPEIAQSAGSTTSSQHGGSLVQLIAYKDRISAEQTVFQHLAQEQLKIRRQLGRLVDAFQDEGESEVVNHASPQFLVPPATLDVDATLREAIVQLSGMQLSPEMSRRDDAFGWQCWSQVQGEYVAFQLVKQFLAMTLTPEQAARRTWEFYSESKLTGSSEPSPSRVAPSSMVRMRRRVLSSGSDHDQSTRLVFRRLTRVHQDPSARSSNSTSPRSTSDPKRPEGGAPLRVTKSIYHVTLTPLASTGGFAVVSRSVPNQEIYEPVDRDIILDESGDFELPLPPADEDDFEHLVGAAPREVHEEWIRELNWWRVEPSESGVVISFAGFARQCLALTPCECFMEMLRLTVQWEQVVLGETPISCLDR